MVHGAYTPKDESWTGEGPMPYPAFYSLHASTSLGMCPVWAATVVRSLVLLSLRTGPA